MIFAVVSMAQSPQSSIYQQIKDKGEIVIGVGQGFPPLSFDRKGKFTGIEAEIAEQLAGFFQVKSRFVKVGVRDFIDALKSRKVDVVIAGVSRSIERGRHVWFSQPYLQITPAVLIDKRVLPQTQFGEVFETRQIQTIWDLKTLPEFTFVTKKGTTHERLLKKYFPEKSLILTDTDAQARQKLFDRKANGFVQDSIWLKYQFRTNKALKNNYALLSGGSRTEALCIAMPFGAYVLKNQVDLFIAEAKRQGTIAGLVRKYAK